MINARKIKPDRHNLLDSFNVVRDTIDFLLKSHPVLYTDPEIILALQRNIDNMSEYIDGGDIQNIIVYPKRNKRKRSFQPINLENKTIVIVEDEEIFFKHWQESAEKYNFKFYTCPQDLISEMINTRLDLDQVGCFILDMNFGKNSKYDGAELCEIIKSETTCPVILASSYIDTEDPRLKIFDYVYNKKHLDIEILTKLFKE